MIERLRLAVREACVLAMSHFGWQRCFFSLILLFCQLPCLAGTDDENLGRFVLAGFRAGREKLVTGQFKASGTFSETSKDWGELTGDVSISCAFDFANGKLRFDRTAPSRESRDPDVSPVGPRDWVPGVQAGQYARREDAIVVLPRGHNIVSILPPTRSCPHWARPFDIRTVGTGHQHDLDWGVMVEKIYSAYESQPIHSVEEEADSVYRVEWVVKRERKNGVLVPDMRRVVWFDGKRDYWPIRFKMWDPYPLRWPKAGQPEDYDWDEFDWGSFAQRQDIELVEVNGFWVPGRVTFVASSGSKKEELLLEWESVNEPVDEVVFSADGFDLSGVEMIVDSRLGKKIIVKRFPSPLGATVETKGGTKYRVFLLFASMALICGVLIYYFRFRHPVRHHLNET